ncbi:MAG: PstC family ABC transporter permease, partial [Pyrinomonadaceae bacterium]
MKEIPILQHPVAAAADQGISAPPTAGPSATKRLSRLKERSIEALLFLAAFSSVAITAGIVGTLLYESSSFFADVSLKEFLTGTLWTPLFASPRFGIMPLVAGTLVTTGVALVVALPIGTVVAIYLSEFAPASVREIIKPALELLSA